MTAGVSIGRLRKRPQFLKAAAANRKWVAPGVIMQARTRIADEAQSADLQIGFTVSKKVGNAVQRNRARRRLRHASAEVLAKSTPASGHDIVLIGRAATLTRPYADLCRDIAQALAKLGVVNGKSTTITSP